MFAVLTSSSLEEARNVAEQINADPLELLCAIEEGALTAATEEEVA